MDTISLNELRRAVGPVHLELIHLEDGAPNVLAAVCELGPRVSDAVITGLLTGDSWRERLLGLAFACHRGPARFYAEMLAGFRDPREISIVPTAAALSVAVNEFGCGYSPDMIRTLDRAAFGGEVGFAIDQIHHAIGIGEAPAHDRGPNYGQRFADHREFYEGLSRK